MVRLWLLAGFVFRSDRDASQGAISSTVRFVGSGGRIRLSQRLDRTSYIIFGDCSCRPTSYPGTTSAGNRTRLGGEETLGGSSRAKSALEDRSLAIPNFPIPLQTQIGLQRFAGAPMNLHARCRTTTYNEPQYLPN